MAVACVGEFYDGKVNQPAVKLFVKYKKEKKKGWFVLVKRHPQIARGVVLHYIFGFVSLRFLYILYSYKLSTIVRFDRNNVRPFQDFSGISTCFTVEY